MTLLLTALLLVQFAAANQSTTCPLFDTCADCVCGTFGYETTYHCNAGCAWLNGVCVAASSTSDPDAIKELYTRNVPSNYDDDDLVDFQNTLIRDGDVNCPISYGDGTVFSVVFLLSLASIVAIYATYVYCKSQGGAKSFLGGW